MVGVTGYGGKTRVEERVINRLRCGHTGLNGSLHLIGKHPTGLCDNCGEVENVEHVLVVCERYREGRRELLEALGGRDVEWIRGMLKGNVGRLASNDEVLKGD